VQTGGVTLTAQQPDNNVVRVTIQALLRCSAAAKPAHEWQGRGPRAATEASARLALRTQQVIAYESGVADTVDPRWLLRRRGHDRGPRGGGDEHPSSGSSSRAEPARRSKPARSNARSRSPPTPTKKQVEANERVIVASTASRSRASSPLTDILRVDPEVERQQVERLRALRAGAPKGREGCARTLADRARGGDNLMPAIVEAALAMARWARSPTACARYSANTARRSSCDAVSRWLFRLRVEEAIAIAFLAPTTYLTFAAQSYARQVGELGPRLCWSLPRLLVAAPCCCCSDSPSDCGHGGRS